MRPLLTFFRAYRTIHRKNSSKKRIILKYPPTTQIFHKKKGKPLENLKVKTGIEGLDNFIEGGFPKGRVYLVAGETGTGKTTFALQYLYYGVSYGDNGIYVTIDEKPERVVEDALTLGWDLEKLIDENRLLMVELSPYFSDIKKVDSVQIVDNLKG
ncbi:MAG: hypothetical protein DRO36_01120 [Candidatus Hecatellales archaeon]|nr:MAG: hypothetical protein DRO36_01120 [Candidatus Hecatellales archaeon]